MKGGFFFFTFLKPTEPILLGLSLALDFTSPSQMFATLLKPEFLLILFLILPRCSLLQLYGSNRDCKV